jgi:opacity protein-like surface antigen
MRKFMAALPMALATMLALAPAPALSQVSEYRVSVTPLIGYRMGGQFDGDDEDEESGSEVDLDDASTFGLILNMPADANTEWELFYSRQSAGLDSATVALEPGLELEVTHILLGGTYVGEGEMMRPFLSGGIGAAHLSPDGAGYDSDTVFAFGLGGGAYFFPESRVGLRLEGRMLGSVIDSDSAIFCGSASGGATCAFRTSGDLLLQFEIFAGLVARF